MTLVKTEDLDAVRYVVLSRPEKRNAFNADLILALGDALRGAADDDAVRSVVIRGDGPVFSAGMDLKELESLSSSPERLREFRRHCIHCWNLAEEMTKPTIAQLHGACFGGALELALACDLRVIEQGTRLGLPEVRLGLVPDLGGLSRLPAVVGLGRAKELIMTGRELGAEEAERIGLASRVAPLGELARVTTALTTELSAGFPIPIGLAKRVMDASARPALAVTLEQEAMAQQLSVAAITTEMRERQTRASAALESPRT